MLQSLLAERFGLRIHTEARKTSGYELVVGKGGARLQPSLPVFTGSEAEASSSLSSPTPSTVKFVYKNCTISRFAQLVTRNTRVAVVDATNLAGNYDIPFEFSVQDLLPKPFGSDDDGLGPSIVDAVERLGLKLKRKTVTVNIIVVDNISQPTAN